MTAAYAEAYGAWSRRAASDGNNRGSPVRDVALVLARQAFDERCKGRDLAQFLVAPVQRVPRYRLLLEALVLRTNEDHADRNDLDEALTLVRDACAKIDAILGEHAVRNEMQLLKSQIHDPANQLSSLVAHRLVRTGDARKLSTSKIETLTFWLTDRALFSCDRPPATTQPYRLRFYAPLTRCVVEAAPFATLSNRCDRAASEQLELAAAEDPRLARIKDALRAERAGTRCLVVRSPRKSFYVELSSEDEARGWLDDVAAHQETPPSLDFAPVATDAPRKRGWLSPRRSRPDVYDFSPRGSEASALSPRGSYDLGSDDDAPSWAPASPPPPPRPRSLLAAARSASASIASSALWVRSCCSASVPATSVTITASIVVVIGCSEAVRVARVSGPGSRATGRSPARKRRRSSARTRHRAAFALRGPGLGRRATRRPAERSSGDDASSARREHSSYAMISLAAAHGLVGV